MPHDLLEFANLLRQRRLRQVETLGSAAEVQLFGHGDEVSKMPKLDVPIHMPNIIIRTNKILDVWLRSAYAESQRSLPMPSTLALADVPSNKNSMPEASIK